jgi:hypothetical protein
LTEPRRKKNKKKKTTPHKNGSDYPDKKATNHSGEDPTEK